MTCPECNNPRTRTFESRELGRAIFRGHACLACSTEWASQETVVTDSLRPLAATRRDRLRSVATGGDEGSAAQLSDLTLLSGSDSGPSKPNQRESKLDEPALLTFPTVGEAKTWAFTEGTRKTLADAFPDMDVMAQARKALGWCETNRRQRKTPAGMGKFLFNWLSRAQNDPKGKPVGKPALFPTPGLCAFHATTWNGDKTAPRHDETCSECRHVKARRAPRPNGEPSEVGGTR